ncbi:MAG: T9SS type A sorting domain-containing protein [Luteibaculaceae bacterium]
MKKIYFLVASFVLGQAAFAQQSNLTQQQNYDGLHAIPTQSVFGTANQTGATVIDETFEFRKNKKGVSRDGELLWSNDFSDPADWVIDNQGVTLANTGFRIGTTVVGYWGSQEWIFGAGNVTNRILSSTSGGNFLYFTNGGTTAGTFGTPDSYFITVAEPVDMSDPDILAAEFSYRLGGARFIADIEVEFSSDNVNWVLAYAHSFQFVNSSGANPIPMAPMNAPTTVSFDVPQAMLGQETVWFRYRWVPLINGPAINWIDYVTGIDDIEITSFIPEPSGEVIWSDDFASGIGNWTRTGADSEQWYYTLPLPASQAVVVPGQWLSPNPPAGGPQPANGAINYTAMPNNKFQRWGHARINSKSRNNGWVSISPDAFNNQPNIDLGNGLFASGWPAATADPEANLVSPIIDLSNYTDAAIGINWIQGSRVCCGAASFNLDVTTNGFVNFETFPVQLAVNATDLAQSININITPALEGGNLSNFQFRFRNAAATYYWHIDDVEVTVIADPNVRVDAAFYRPYFAGNTTSRWAEQEISSFVINGSTTQAPPLTPGVVFTNIGGEVLTNLSLTATIIGPNDFTATVTSPNIASFAIGASDTLRTTPFTLNSEMPLGAYQIVYQLSADQTFSNPDIAQSTRTFRLSNYEYANDRFSSTGAFTNTTSADSPSGDYRIGNSFISFSEATVYSLGVQLSTQSDVGPTFELSLWSHQSNNPNDGEFLEGIDIEVTQNMLGNFRWFNFADPVQMDEGEGYILWFEYLEGGTPGSPGPKVFVNTSGTTAGQLVYMRRLGNPNQGFFLTDVPMMRMNLNADLVNVERLKEKELFLRAFPNPSSNNFEVQYVLDRDAQVLVELVDITGKVIMKRNEGTRASGVQHNFTIDGSKLTSGMYFYSLIVDGKRHTKKLVKN